MLLALLQTSALVQSYVVVAQEAVRRAAQPQRALSALDGAPCTGVEHGSTLATEAAAREVRSGGVGGGTRV